MILVLVSLFSAESHFVSIFMNFCNLLFNVFVCFNLYVFLFIWCFSINWLLNLSVVCFGIDCCLKWHFDCQWVICLMFIGLDLFDILFELKKVYLDKIWPLDWIWMAYAVTCCGNLNLSQFKGCLELLVYLSMVCVRYCSG